ncbi:TetR/AcrR family transcriptional regulator [Nitrospirillum sp. BR 11164]|uniref:TetR/AcrR family transcriptional regulator n=1 Tax=Nitrospirillum sp. BR 11164 TaxID=3104324 RepID=UPI002AFE7402|nr:TetR/AcrR family transcriptional regulator [Nitrospirillum sp. BR 11164]MEA1652918.1 TetR/AcrR family transcriptional regulator [Nitrospirillum sp. BR 11164]
MKDWAADHPKAKLMARKRAAIVDAAREAFLRDGYGGASMERIAKDAGVSIMTLYRHAEGKDDLFSAVIAQACHPADQAEQARIQESLQRPLPEILIFIGVMFQERIASPATTTLFRTVMVETMRFPHLADIAYRGLIEAHEDSLDAFLGQRVEAATLDPGQRRKLCAAFLDRLVGLDSFRVLLGLEGATDAERLDRATSATAELISALPA